MSTNVWLKKTKTSWKSKMSVVLLMLSGKHKTTHLYMHLHGICTQTFHVLVCTCVYTVYVNVLYIYTSFLA